MSNFPAHLRQVTIKALQDREYALEAFYDGAPEAREEAAKCREAIQWLTEQDMPQTRK